MDLSSPDLLVKTGLSFVSQSTRFHDCVWTQEQVKALAFGTIASALTLGKGDRLRAFLLTLISFCLPEDLRNSTSKYQL